MTSRPAPTAATVDGTPDPERAAGSSGFTEPVEHATMPILPAGDLGLVADRMIADKYRLTRAIGHGGMGSVWEAEHEALGRRVAVKFLKRWSHVDASLPDRFASEARMVAAIKHRFVVDVFDFGITDDGLYYMVLELLDGKTLAARMSSGPAMSAFESVQLIADCLRGLHAVHEVGVVHRDLKPENIFVVQDADGSFPKLIDFGISKRDEPLLIEGDDSGRRKSRLTQPGTVVGTLDYMPPEQLRGRVEVDRRADVYSMGVILYELLVGRLPYDHDNIADLMVAITNSGAPPLSRARPDLGAELSNTIARALSAAPEARYPTALALRNALLASLPRIPAHAQAGAAHPSPGRGHATELQLQAAADVFGAASARARWTRHRLWIGLSVGGALLLVWLVLNARPSTRQPAAVRGDAVRYETPSAVPVPVSNQPPLAPPAAARSDTPAVAPTESGAATSPGSGQASQGAARTATKDARKPKDGRARATPARSAPTQKIYRELDF